MVWRIGPGPVFRLEAVRQSRRWQTYTARVAVVGVILATLVVCQMVRSGSAPLQSQRDLAAFAQQLFEVFAIAHVSLVLFLVPALSADVLIPERNRGTLFHLMATDLASMEVALGKWLGRVLPAVSLLLASAPVAAMLMLLGGVSPQQTANLYLLLIGYTLFLPALCVLLSLWLRRGADLLALVYLAVVLWCLLPAARWFLGRLGVTTPFYEWTPYSMLARNSAMGSESPRVFFDHLTQCGVLLALTAALLIWAGWRLRPACLKVAGEAPPRQKRKAWRKRGREPDLDSRPILWLEWARSRGSLATRLHTGVLLLGGCLAAWGFVYSWFESRSTFGDGVRAGAFALAGFLALSHLLALTAIAGQLAEDRANRHLEMLAVTPLEPHEILDDRRAAAYRLLRTGAVGATALILLGMPREPFLVWVGMTLMFVCASSLARFVSSLALWLGLRFRHPRWGTIVGAGFLVGLNVGVFLLFFAMFGPGSNLQSPFALLLWIVVGVVGVVGVRFAWRSIGWLTGKRLWAANARRQGCLTAAAVVVALFVLWTVVGNFSNGGRFREAPLLLAPFVAFVFSVAAGLDHSFWDHEFGVGMLVVMLAVMGGWVLIASWLDRSSVHWLAVRMHDDETPGKKKPRRSFFPRRP